jgi:hypothetical protein
MTPRTFTLVVFPDGKCLLSTERIISPQEVDEIDEAWKSWKNNNGHVLIVGDSKVVMVKEIELEIKDG